MQRDPQGPKALSLHVTTVFGRHESTENVIFIPSHDCVKKGGRCARELHPKVEKEANVNAPILSHMLWRQLRTHFI